MKNKEINTLMSNTVMLYIMQVSGYIFPLLTFPYLTRVLDIEYYGMITFVTTTMVYFQMILDFGFILSGTKECALYRRDNKKLSEVFSAVLISKILLGLFAFIILLLLINTLPNFDDKKTLMILYYLATFTSILMPDFLFRGLEKMKIIMYISLLGKLIYTISIFIFIHNSKDYLLVPILVLLSNVFSFYWIYKEVKKLHVKFVFVGKELIIDTIKQSSIYFISRIASTAYSSSNIFILGLISSNSTIALFSVANTIIGTIKSLFSPIADSIYPYMLNSKNYKIIKIILILMMPIVILGCGVVFYFADSIILILAGSDYLDSSNILKQMLPIVIFTLPAYLLGFPVLGAMGKMRLANLSVIYPAIFHLIALTSLLLLGHLTIPNIIKLTIFTEALVLVLRIIFIYLNKRKKYTILNIESYLLILKRLIKSLVWGICSKLKIIPGKIVVDNFNGRGYGDNPKYIIQEILKQKQNYKIIWLLDKKDKGQLPEGVIPVKFNSLRAIYELATAEFWIDNVRKNYKTIKRPEQKYIQTWHGAYGGKKVEKDAEEKLSSVYVKHAQIDSNNSDLFISNSKAMSDLYRSSFWYEGEILEVGFPRNDIFFNDKEILKKKVREYFDFLENYKICLYAPTFRSDCSLDVYNLDFESCLKSLEKKFGGDWILLIRLHPNICEKSKDLVYNNKNIFNASYYDDMQELLCVSDCLITDYSSSVYDFVLTKNPCFLYTPDLNNYLNDRGFYINIEENIFPRANSNEALNQIINDFDEKYYLANVNEFLNKYAVIDTGNASTKIVDWINNKRIE